MPNKKPNYSKILCVIGFVQFFLVIGVYIFALVNFYDTSAFTVIFPSSATITSAGCVFYFTKAKTENLSKQRIRYVYLKLFLEEKLSAEAYQQVDNELNNIDFMVDNKLNQMLQDSINQEDTNINNTNL